MTRWAAIILAIVFALGTVFLGVGSKTGDVFAGCSKKSGGGISASSSFEDREAYYKDLIAQNPQDTDSMLALANIYSTSDVGRFGDAITYYNMYLAIVPTNVDVLMLMGRAELSAGSNESAVKTLTQVTTIQPTNSYAFLELGLAAKGAGQNQTAILAWNRWLELNPNDSNAQAIKDEITKLVALPAVQPPTSTIPGTQGTVTVPVQVPTETPLPVGP